MVQQQHAINHERMIDALELVAGESINYCKVYAHMSSSCSMFFILTHGKMKQDHHDSFGCTRQFMTMLGAPVIQVQFFVVVYTRFYSISRLENQAAAGLTLEEHLTIDFLGSCAALQALVSASFYSRRPSPSMQGLERLNLPIRFAQ